MNTTIKDILRLLTRVIECVVGLFFLYLVAAVCISLGFPIAIVIAGLLFGMPAMMIILADMVPVLRRQQQLMCLFYLEQALRMNQPLVAVLRAAQRSERWLVSRQLDRMCKALEAGRSLPDAVEEAIPYAPRRWLGLIASADRTGRLPQVLPTLLHSERIRVLSQQPTVTPGLSLPMVEVMALFMTLVFFSVVMLPKFRKIFDDFNTSLPATTQWVFGTIEFLMPWLVLLVPIIGFFWIMWMMGRYFGGIRLTGVVRNLADSVLWSLPIVHRIERDRGLGDSLTTIAHTLEAGSTLPAAIHQARNLRINHHLQTRLTNWARLIEQGKSVDQAAKVAGLPGFCTAMLASAVVSDCLPQTLGFLGGYYSCRSNRLIELLRAVTMPLITVILGLLVGWVVLSMFLPLAVLIRYAANDWNALIL